MKVIAGISAMLELDFNNYIILSENNFEFYSHYLGCCSFWNYELIKKKVRLVAK